MMPNRKTRGVVATAAGLAMLYLSGLATTPAGAGDLGGSCCADLEDRIAELEATTARKDNRKVSLAVYGQVNKAILLVDGFHVTEEEIIDNHISGTRFGFMGEARISASWKAGYRLEVGVNDQAEIPVLGDDPLKLRHSYWWVSGPIGQLSMGLTSMATDGVAHITLANTEVASRMLSLQPVSSALLLGIDLPFSDLRRNVVRYDTPTMGGFQASASWANGDTPFGFYVNPDHAWDVALRYAGELGGFRVATGIGLSEQDNSIGLLLGFGGRERVVSGSASVMHTGSGLFGSAGFGWVTKEQALVYFGLDDADYAAVHMQGGWQKNILGFGATTIFGEYAFLDLEESDTPTPSLIGAGLVQSIDAAAMDVYAAWRRYDLDSEGEDTIDTFMGGARIRF